MNELMAEFKGKDLPSKKKEYVAYLDKEESAVLHCRS